MAETIKAFAIITAKAGLKWVLIVATGTIVTAIFAVVAIFQSNGAGSGGGHGSAIPFLISLCFTNFYAFALLVGAPVFLFLYFIIANKIAIHTAIYLAYKNKAETYVTGKVIALVDGVTGKNNLVGAISNQAMLRAKLLEANSNDKDSSRIKRGVMRYMFKKIKLDDIDFTNKDIKLSGVIVQRLSILVSEKARPSLLLFWVLLAVHAIILVLACTKG